VRRHYSILFLGVIIASFSSILIRYSGSHPMAIATYRMGFASLIMLVISSMAGNKSRMIGLSRIDKLLVILSGVSLGMHFASWMTSLSYTSVAVSVIIVDSSPLFVAAISYYLLKEKMARHGYYGIMILLSGGFLIVMNEISNDVSLHGVFLALLGSITLACYIAIGRKVRREMDTLAYVSTVYMVSFMFLFAMTIAMGIPLSGYGGRELTIFLLLAIGPSCIGHTTYNYCLRHFTAPQVSASILGEPLGATILAFALLGEEPTILVMIGGAMVITGLLIVMNIIWVGGQ